METKRYALHFSETFSVDFQCLPQERLTMAKGLALQFGMSHLPAVNIEEIDGTNNGEITWK